MNITREGFSPAVAFSAGVVPAYDGCETAMLKEKPMKISARNILKGKVTEIVKGATTSHVRIDIGGGVIVTASITNEAVADLALENGKQAYAVIKASDVMVGID
jgi:molybdopterin-binding protein